MTELTKRQRKYLRWARLKSVQLRRIILQYESGQALNREVLTCARELLELGVRLLKESLNLPGILPGSEGKATQSNEEVN